MDGSGPTPEPPATFDSVGAPDLSFLSNVANEAAGALPGEMPQPDLAEAEAAAAAAAQPSELTYVWGTGIAVEVFKADLRRFLTEFTAGAAEVPKYIQELQNMRTREGRELQVDFTELRSHSVELFEQIVNNPSECLQMMCGVTEEIYRQLFPDVPEDFGVSIAARNLPTTASLRNLSPPDIETLVAIQGMVVRTSKIIPEVRVAHFECWSCKHSERSVVERGRIFEPIRCSNCGQQYSYQLIHNLSLFEDKQIIRIQEAPENLTDGETPVTISAVVYSDLVDTVVPGDRVVCTGIYRSSPMKLNPNTRIVKAIFRTHIDALHLEKGARSNSLGAEELHVEDFDDKTVDAIHRISRRPDIYELLVRSLSPSIFGHEQVKMGILSLMFGGCKKQLTHGNFRSELNIILCGDPGVAKSQLLSQVHNVTPRGVYTSGKGSSSVGLTAFVVKDADTGEFVLEPGALVLSDRGICCIDEFDKMDESTRSVLHEVMEQQTLSIAKAGIIAQLNARTSILAAANPKESQWNPTMNIVENLQIEPTLLSRFDLIFLLLDKQDEAMDRRLSSHVLSMFMETGTVGGQEQEEETLPLAWYLEGKPGADYLKPDMLRKYIAYCREKSIPALTDDSHRSLVNSYVDLRRARGGGKTVSATLRQLESMIRIAESRARMRMASSVTEEDAAGAKRLISEALKDAATDPRTGLINLEMFASADPSRNSVEGNIKRLEAVIRQRFTSAGKQSATVHDLRSALTEASAGQRPIAPTQFMELLSIMSGGDFIQSFTAATVTFA